jgi:ADP-heptose:LPS heptosyltransferase
LNKVLVIKLGAFGDFVLAFGPFAAIRAQHPGAEITLLTTPPFAEFARAAPWFDRVLVDTRPRPWDLPALSRLRRALRGFDQVYDLQTSKRSGWYFWLAGGPAWSGIAVKCSHPHANPDRNAMHTVERQRDQLAMAGVSQFPTPDLNWLRGKKEPAPLEGKPTTSVFSLSRPSRERVGVRAALPLESISGRQSHPHPGPLPPAGEGEEGLFNRSIIGRGGAILIPGAAPHRPRKRWPAERFGELATLLASRGPVTIVGSAADSPHAAAIRTLCPQATDLTGRTTLLQLAQTIATASLAVGNDTGPTHLAAALGLPTIALFSDDSDPALTRPRGDVTVLAVPDLADLPVARVAAALPPVHVPQPANLEAL